MKFGIKGPNKKKSVVHCQSYMRRHEHNFSWITDRVIRNVQIFIYEWRTQRFCVLQHEASLYSSVQLSSCLLSKVSKSKYKNRFHYYGCKYGLDIMDRSQSIIVWKNICRRRKKMTRLGHYITRKFLMHSVYTVLQLC